MQNRRRRLLVGLALALTAPQWAHAQKAGSPRRVGFLTSRSRPPALEDDFVGAWVVRLRELGYIEGRDFVVDWRFADGGNARLPALAAALLASNPDALVGSGTPAAIALQKATSRVPIVIAGVADPVGTGLVASLAKPGGNITGTAILATDLSIKGLEFLRSAAPGLRRVAVITNPTNPIAATSLRQVEASAAAFGVTLLRLAASSSGEIEAAFEAIVRARPDGLIVTPDPLFSSHARQMAELAVRARVPAVYPFRPFAEAGGLMSYGQNIHENYRRAADYLDRIFRGARPGDLPIEQPTQIEFIVNRKAAEAIGLKLPQSILVRATHVID